MLEMKSVIADAAEPSRMRREGESSTAGGSKVCEFVLAGRFQPTSFSGRYSGIQRHRHTGLLSTLVEGAEVRRVDPLYAVTEIEVLFILLDRSN